MRALTAVLIVATIMLFGAAASAAPSLPAQDDDQPGPVQISEAEQPQGGIIPKPNSGSPPENPGDRGGAYQWLLFGLIIVFMAVAAGSVYRSSRRARASQRPATPTG